MQINRGKTAARRTAHDRRPTTDDRLWPLAAGATMTLPSERQAWVGWWALWARTLAKGARERIQRNQPSIWSIWALTPSSSMQICKGHGLSALCRPPWADHAPPLAIHWLRGKGSVWGRDLISCFSVMRTRWWWWMDGQPAPEGETLVPCRPLV